MDGILTRLFATHANILSSRRSTAPHGTASVQTEMLSYRMYINYVHTLSFGTSLEPRYIFGAKELDQ